jgi:hypothetical protein
MKGFHGSHLVGTFPNGFKIKVAMTSTYVNKAASFVLKRLGSQPGLVGALHIFVSKKADGERLLSLLSCRYNCRFVSSDTTPDEVNQVSLNWVKGKHNVLISTSITLVGNENPHCRHLTCAGYLYDLMQIVQALGCLQHFMRDSTGQILFSVPEKLSDFRINEDQQRFTSLLNENILSQDDHRNYKLTMTYCGV